jgi:hypothetical protein
MTRATREAAARADPFGAAEIRARVLDAWRASPARFREDANAEEDAVRGGYRDRLVVELVQNAVDAAAAAGVPARVCFRVTNDGGREVLDVANTGAPLTAEGLQALATLRASAKRDAGDAVGRFGVGFAAVLAVTDEPAIVSGGSGGVAYGWSVARSRELVTAEPALAEELARRDGHLPVLRLPFLLESSPEVPAGYDTLVRLPLRDAGLAHELLDGLDPTLPLVLPGLAELVVGDRTLRVVAEPDGLLALDDAGEVSRWRLSEIRGELPEQLLADRPVEERGRTSYLVRALTPVGDRWPPRVPRVLRAPQPTDEPLSLPVVVSVPVPIEPSRRHTVPGPLRSWLLEQAGVAVAALAVPEPESLSLVPVGLAVGEADGLLREAVLRTMRDRPWLPGDCVLELGDASVAAYPVLREVLAGLLPPEWPARSPALEVLGVRRLDTGQVVEALQGLRHPPAWWHRVYTALEEAPDRDALAALPVPLVSGATAVGPRGLLLPDPDLSDLPELDDLPVRVVHPAAAHPLLLRLGARAGTPRAVLDALAPQADDLEAERVLPLVAAAGLRPGEVAWLAGLDLGGDYLAGSPLADVLDPAAGLEPVPHEVEKRWGADVLAACGVLAEPVVVQDPDAVLDLDEAEDWADTLPGEVEPGTAGAVADLDLLRWPDALRVLCADRDARDAILVPSSYTAWWLARHPVFDGQLPAEVRAPQADPLLERVYDDPPSWLDAVVAGAIGCRVTLPDDDDGLFDLLDRVGDPERELDRAQVRALYAEVAERDPTGAPPVFVRAVGPDGELVCVPGPEAVLVDAPDLLPLVGGRPVVPAPAGSAPMLAGLLGVPLASGLAAYEVVAEHPLTVRDVDGREVHVSWRVTADGVVHADGPEGEGRARAWRDGRWSQRHAYVASLRDPAAARLLALEDDLA